MYRSEFIFTFSNLVVFYSIIEHHERCNLCCEHLRWFMKALKEVHSSINHKLVAHGLPHLVLNVICILSSFRFYHLLLYHSEFIFTFSSLVVHVILQLHGGSPQEGRKLKAKLVTVD